MANHLAFLQDKIKDMKDNNLYGALPVMESPQGPRVIMNGKEVISLSSNSYLNLTSHPRMKQAAQEMLEKYGVGTGAVRQIAGTITIHNEVEEKLAKYKGTESALIFVAGIAANRGTIQALMEKGDVIISDELNHGSIIDGVRLTKADRKIYPHSDMDGLKKALEESKGANNTLVVTDGVFSMDGDIAKLPEIAELAEEYGAITMVDDAHGDGVLGKDGSGIISHFNLHGKIDIDMGTLSKAFGCLGGYIAGVPELRDYMTNRARSFIFTTSLPPAVIGAISAVLDIVQDEPEHLKNLWDNGNYLKKELSGLGFDTGHSETPITPVIVGTGENANNLAAELMKEGIFAKPIVYPLVEKDKARIRVMVNAGHTREDLDYCIQKFGEIGKKLAIL